MDPVFDQEQSHLDETYRKLESIERDLVEQMHATLDDARTDRANMLDELATDFAGDVNLETYVELEAMHHIIDDYNQFLQTRERRLASTRLLMRQPYFAKVTLQFSPSAEPRDVYIGAAGMTDDTRRHFIVDWRSPVAETYYNQENGHTSYRADGRTIEVDLLLRRQFDITRSTLNSFFDTTVAIQDPLLLASLRKRRTSQLGAITATIQKEQNLVIRHDDVPVLLVRGIAGSGKTSVLLQRIAYLLYRQHETLSPSDVILISPNDVFSRYINQVLPDMGERNPQTFTWNSLMTELGLGNRGLGKDATGAALCALDEAVATLRIQPDDVCDIVIDDERVLTSAQVFKVVSKYHDRIPAGTHLAGLVEEDLTERVEQRAKRLANSEAVQDSLADLDIDEQFRIFGHPIQPKSEEELRDLAQRYLTNRYQAALEAIADGRWLRIDRIGMRVLGKQNLSSAEHLFLKMALTGVGNRSARYVMVDEVQDYTVPQLMTLERYFPNAHFLLLGDENQAIKPDTASFADIHRVFERAGKQVHTCELMTSYRSAPEITDLFCSLMPEEDRPKVASVQESGSKPLILACTTDDDYVQALRTALDSARQRGGLCAMIAAHEGAAKRIAKLLGDDAPLLLDDKAALPDSGVVLMGLALAKGLEFDEVIIPDAQARTYGDDELSRHRLYTAISRATKRVTILSQGPLSPLLNG